MNRVLRPTLVGFQQCSRGLSSDDRRCECSLWSQTAWKDLVQSMDIPREARMGKQCQCWEAVSWLIEGRPSQGLESEPNLIRGGWAQLSRPESLRQVCRQKLPWLANIAPFSESSAESQTALLHLFWCFFTIVTVKHCCHFYVKVL